MTIELLNKNKALDVISKGTVSSDTASGEIVGYESVVVNLAGASLDSGLADAAGSGGDIDTPDAWTDLIDMSGGPSRLFLLTGPSIDPVRLQIGGAVDGVGDKLRFQVIIDGVTVADAKVESDGASDQTCGWQSGQMDSAAYVFPMHFNSTFKIRGTREGNFTDADSYFRVAYIYREDL